MGVRIEEDELLKITTNVNNLAKKPKLREEIDLKIEMTMRTFLELSKLKRVKMDLWVKINCTLSTHLSLISPYNNVYTK